MFENISVDAQKLMKRTIKAFTNLLKEFPKNADDNFVYDESTLEKIGTAGVALDGLASLLNRESHYLGEAEKKIISGYHQKLDKFIKELPQDPSDEFSYHPEFHDITEEARETVEKLSQAIE